VRIVWIYTDERSPQVAVVDDVASIAEHPIDNEPGIRVTTSGGTTYDLKKSSAQIVVQWE
jgi:DNA-directed RNA polymerase subunit L